MRPERWRRIEAIFHRAVELAPEARAAWVAAECGDDVDLRVEIERLLQSDGEPEAAAGDDAFTRLEAHTSPAAADPRIGQVLGAYRLVARLGVGGMGMVYRAERSDGLFRQEVAIKLIRSEFATASMLRRFEFERLTLASLQHPNIAHLFDGGTTADGCPYFVMELVRGEPIDRHCARERLSMTARLQLFLQVCRAVHCAHQNLVVHCDLKPANILIDADGVPRLLDFGIARWIGDGVSAAPQTLARQLTPEYASPEQLAGAAVTTAHDVYSLGVVLYELLTGQRPFAAAGHSAASWETLVREREPERPSTRLRRGAIAGGPDLAAAFGSSAARMRRALRGDLDRIVLMALRKEPERRYASVRELAEDIERHLAGRPVRARPNSLGYLTSRFLLRHRVMAAAVTMVLGALVFGTFASWRGERRAQVEAQHAQVEADSFQGIASFLMDAFLPTQPAQDAAWQARARDRILDHVRRVNRQFAASDHERANMLDILGQVCLRLDLLEDGERLVREALAIRTAEFGAESLEAALSLRSLAQLEFRRGDFTAACELLTTALPLHRATPTATHADVAAVANDLATCLRNLGRIDEAEALHREALALRRAADPAGLPVAESLNNLAGVHLGRGEFDRAIAVLREALGIRESILGSGHALTVQTTTNLALALWRQGEAIEARRLMQQAEAGYLALGGDGEDGLASLLVSLAAMQSADGDFAQAAGSLERALDLNDRRFGAGHPATGMILARLAFLDHRLQRDAAARDCWQRALELRRTAPASAVEIAEVTHGYGMFLCDAGEPAAAIPLLEETLSLHRAHALLSPGGTGQLELALGRCLLATGQPDAARAHVLSAIAAFDAVPDAAAAERERARALLAEVESCGR